MTGFGFLGLLPIFYQNSWLPKVGFFCIFLKTVRLILVGFSLELFDNCYRKKKKMEIISVCFNGKTYFNWEFQLRMFLGKDLWGRIDGTVPKPSFNKVTTKDN